jgi:AAT family amino acid transporter
MTATLSPSSTSAPPKRSPSWAVFGLANLAVVTAVALATWYLLADPQISPWNFYPLPFNAALFWAILFVVFIGFNCEFAGFDRLSQPARGIAILGTTAVFAVAVTWLLANGLGRLFPDFAADRADGLGYFAGALFVLFGFGTWVMAVLNWKHWPWTALGLRQSLVGLCEIAFIAVPTLALYLVLGLPSVSLSATDPLMSVDTVLGWFYSIVVSVILTGQTLDNWPWRIFGGERNPRAVVLASTVGNVVLGTAIYFVMVPLVEILVGSVATTELGDAIHQFPAQLGVCWAFWMIFWANAFGNRPTRFGDGRNLLLRAALTFGLAVVTFLVYYRFAAEHVLHEPVVAGDLRGNALGFLDWLVLWTLLYVVGFQSFGLRRWAPSVAGS